MIQIGMYPPSTNLPPCPHCGTPIGTRQRNCGTPACLERAELAAEEAAHKRRQDV